MTGRRLWVIAHRWAGLTIAGFLVVVGATGALLPFDEELRRLCAPALWAVTPPSPQARPLDGLTLATRVEQATGGKILYVPLDSDSRHAVDVFVTARPGRPALAYDEVIADPFTGAVRAKTRYGDLSEGVRNLVPFLYLVHVNLALGRTGQLALGLAALVWTVDCFVGFYLTLPTRTRRAPGSPSPRGWAARWRPAWTIRPHARGHKLNFDLHRAGGLWLWPLLLVFAWSAVAFNLREVHDPVMRLLGAPAEWTPPPLPRPLEHPPVAAGEALQAGRRAAQVYGRSEGFTPLADGAIGYDAASGTYTYRLRTTLDIRDRGAGAFIWIDGRDGRALHMRGPLGGTVAEAADAWMAQLHTAGVLGLPYRVFVSMFGLLIVGLSVTGVLIWIRKRSARLLRVRGASSRAPRNEIGPELTAT